MEPVLRTGAAAMVTMTSEHSRNRRTFNAVASTYAGSELFPAEREQLRPVIDKLDKMDVLDLGVGAGRTTYSLAPLARTYVGIDYADDMVEICRRRFGESDRRKFICADATDLSAFPTDTFDLVMFSFNGLDYVDFDSRQRALSEIHRVLRPGAPFLFSSHALESFPWPDALPPINRPVRFAKKMVWNLRRRWANRRIDLAEIQGRGWAFLQDGAHSFGLTTFYGTRAFQLAELRGHHFEVAACYAQDGRLLRGEEAVRDAFIHYSCRSV